MQPFLQAITQSTYARRQGDPHIADFMAGNPQELALPGFVAALSRWSVPQDKDWFAYKVMESRAQAAAAMALSERLGMAFGPDDIFLTRGAFGGLMLALRAVVDPDDEVIFVSPPWFFYEAMIIATGATPVRVRIHQVTFDLDLEAIAGALSPRTRALILNTPHNPTGKIYPPATLERLAALLSDAAHRAGRPIYLISDESYSRILFDGRAFPSPGRFYGSSFLVHTYSKSALAPGQRLGYVAVPPAMPDGEQVRTALLLSALADGFALPDVVMQYALPEIEQVFIDLADLQRKRDRLVQALRDQGYALHVPEATFYLLPRSPLADDVAFTELLAQHDVFVLPGTAMELPGYFRLSLTATDEMIERALPVFGKAIKEATASAM
jgi:aspartate aminotransferase